MLFLIGLQFIEAQACQTITSQIDSFSITPNADGFIQVCPGDEITLTGSGIFSDNGTGATFEWDLGDGNTITGQTATFSYTQPGIYLINLNIRDTNIANDPLGCPNTNLLNQVVQVSTDIDFTGTQALENEICFGDSVEIEGVFNTQEVIFDCTPPVSEVTFLPDGLGASYTSSITVNCFGSGQTLTDISQLTSICLNMEHSWVADLTIEIISPNGQSVILHDMGGGSANLGIPWATGVSDGDSENTTPGTGFTYCFVPNSSNPTLEGGVQSGGTFPFGDGATTYTDDFIPAGDYSSINPLSGLVGSPLNGDWTIMVTDNFERDNGYIFEWTLDFDPSILPQDATFTPVVVSAAWDTDPSIISTSGNNITVQPTTSGQNCYTLRVINDFGCEYTEQVCIEVRPEIVANPIPDQFVCDDDNDGFSTFNLTSFNATVLGGQSTADFVVSYHNTMADAEANTNPITGNYTNAVAFTLETIFVRVENINNPDCFATTSFDINVLATPVANTVNDQLLCDDDNDGFWDFDLDALRATVFGGQSTTDFTITFHGSTADADANLNPLPDVYTNQVANTQETIFVRIENNSNTDCFSTISFNINVFDSPIANTVNDQLICDDNNDGFWDFDLAALQTAVLGTQAQADFTITYHRTQADADNSQNALPAVYTNEIAFQEETIFARIENNLNATCFDATSFLIDVFDQPTATAFTFELCDDAVDGDDTNGFVVFDLASINAQILGAQDPTQFTVTYHTDQANADANTGALPNLYTNVTTNADQIVVRVENNDNTNCFETALIDLVVNPLPVITASVELFQCDDDTDGFTDFNLTEANILISANAANETFSYYLSMADATNANNPIPNPIAYTNTDPSSNPDIVFVRVETNNGCFRIAQLDLLVSTTQIPANFELLFEACDDDLIDGDNTNGITAFDFSTATTQILALFPANQNITISYYETEADALAETNAISDISNHRNDTSPFDQGIYVRVDSDLDNACLGLGVHVRLQTINPTPNLNPADIILCDDTNPGDLIETFNLTQNEAFIFNGDPNVSATYHLTFADADAGTAAITNPAAYINTDPTETIYVRVENITTGCFATVDFDIMVNPLPDANITITDFFECENNTDFIFDFDLSTKTNEILNGQDPSVFAVTYHETQAEADNLTGILPLTYTNTSNPQQIFVAITNTVTGCSISTLTFNIEVTEGANANPDGEPLIFEICDNVADNDGFGQFDLATQDAEILDGQDPMMFTLTYHDDLNEAMNGTDEIPTLYENTSNPQIIYARVSNNIAAQDCFEVVEIMLQVNLFPEFELDPLYVLCVDLNGTEVVDVPPVIDTGLSATDFSFLWTLNGAILPTETGPSLVPTQGGTYEVTVTDITTSTLTMCETIATTQVIESGIPIVTAEVTSEAFSGNNTIRVTATGIGDYGYSLDNGPYQDSNVFEDVSAGDHLVLARDINGCGIASTTITVIDYPRFFTPNGDGNNDQWNIEGIDSQPGARIFIFDRYGKLLKQISPTSSGWDGTFNGNLMPTNDYWFSLEYQEPITGETRTFRAHFTLKR
ncbi:T9SS type B sorting domain-containing protein [Winogradskyella sp. E313]|uniref:T9SS type B sorting domain-containing protein n=2 Tax=Winogradskyella immobilis TaxID=2816852 RepID=A0ABS8EMI0_9FLAO|nr:T9SS type B sorting domain-containing protein [Winogradskyella immobilis]MCG0016527.1 T9SS type B sorting domain-containing protein [Winogradskyella immobilis]